MINNSNLAFAIDNFTVPEIEHCNNAIETSVGSVADAIRKAGETYRLYRVNSGNISPRQP